jgi:signal transduction histidine kinase
MMSARARLQKQELSGQDQRYWTSVLAGAEAINRMATNLLDVTRSQEGTLVPRKGTIHPAELLAEVHELMGPLAGGRGVELALERDLPRAPLVADAELLRRVLQNLVDNAVRHSPRGSRVRLAASVTREGAGGDILFTVVDEGPGVPDADKERIFEKYARLKPEEPSDPQLSQGRGLGLAFCRLAAHAHGGRIWVEDNQPKGSRFLLKLPLGE